MHWHVCYSPKQVQMKFGEVQIVQLSERENFYIFSEMIQAKLLHEKGNL